jgi:hypothetical protein
VGVDAFEFLLFTFYVSPGHRKAALFLNRLPIVLQLFFGE